MVDITAAARYVFMTENVYNTPNKTNPISTTIDNRVNILDTYYLAPTNNEKHRNLAGRYPHSLSEGA